MSEKHRTNKAQGIFDRVALRRQLSQLKQRLHQQASEIERLKALGHKINTNWADKANEYLARITELEAELATYKAGNVPITDIINDSEALAMNNEEQAQEIQWLWKVFMTYSQHKADCAWLKPTNEPCDCGLEQALERRE